MSRIEVTRSSLIGASGYTHPHVLVETEWVAKHLQDPSIRLIEADENALEYGIGHIPGAIKLDWYIDVQDSLSRDFIDQASFERLMSRWGITNDKTIVFYGDQYNWYACFAFWFFSLYGHKKMKILNGGRSKWLGELRELTKEAPHFEPVNYVAESAITTVRIFREEVFYELRNPNRGMIDVRSPQEYSGKLLYVAECPKEAALCGGHIPGAKNIPWELTVNHDGTFRSVAELRRLYSSKDIMPDKDVITYCRIGERAAHSWFVLTHLLGFPRVRNYDGSWTEWSSMVRMPIEK